MIRLGYLCQHSKACKFVMAPKLGDWAQVMKAGGADMIKIGKVLETT